MRLAHLGDDVRVSELWPKDLSSVAPSDANPRGLHLRDKAREPGSFWPWAAFPQQALESSSLFSLNARATKADSGARELGLKAFGKSKNNLRLAASLKHRSEASTLEPTTSL